MKLKDNIKKIPIQHALDIYEIMQMVLKRENKIQSGPKSFWVVALNSDNKILNIEHIYDDNITRAAVKPADLLSIPLQKKAAGIILVQLRSSGTLAPSEEDEDLTDFLIQACRLAEVPLLDHVIIKP